MHNRKKTHLGNPTHQVVQNEILTYIKERLKYLFMEHNVNIRRNQLMTIPKHSISMFERLSYAAVKLYNSLSEKIKCRIGNTATTNFKKHFFKLQIEFGTFYEYLICNLLFQNVMCLY